MVSVVFLPALRTERGRGQVSVAHGSVMTSSVVVFSTSEHVRSQVSCAVTMCASFNRTVLWNADCMHLSSASRAELGQKPDELVLDEGNCGCSQKRESHHVPENRIAVRELTKVHPAIRR